MKHFRQHPSSAISLKHPPQKTTLFATHSLLLHFILSVNQYWNIHILFFLNFCSAAWSLLAMLFTMFLYMPAKLHMSQLEI